MNKELYVSSTPHETKVALVEDDQLAEVYFEREQEYTLAGSIYKGRVTRVLPGMQSAFVDIGLERDAFLYVSDFLELQDDDDEFGDVEISPVLVDVKQQDTRQSASAPQAIASEVEEEALEEGDEGEELETSAGQETAAETTDETGARRWRGRRRRRGRRGGRERLPEQQRSADAAELSPEEPVEAAAVEEIESEPEVVTAEPVIEDETPTYEPMILPGESIARYKRNGEQPEQRAEGSEPAPQQERSFGHRDRNDRDRGRGGRDRGGRDRDRGEREPRESRDRFDPLPPGYQPIVLPGESISKYRNVAPVALESSPEEAPINPVVDVEAHATSQDRDVAAIGTEGGVEQAVVQDVGLSETAAAIPTVVPEHETAPEATGSAVSEQVLAPPAPRPSWNFVPPVRKEFHEEAKQEAVKQEQPKAEAFEVPASVAPQPEARVEESRGEPVEAAILDNATPVVEPAAEETDSAQESEEERRDEQRIESMNVAAVFGGAETESPGAETLPEPQGAVEAEHGETPTQETGTYSPEGGVVEHEEIDEEEADSPVLAEDTDGYHFNEFEEETHELGSQFDEHRPGSIGEAFRDAETGGEYDFAANGDEFEESELVAEGEEEDIEEEEGEEGEESESNGRAELRAPAATAGYPKRAERFSDPRRRDRNTDRGRRGGRRGGPRPGGRHEAPRAMPLISDLLKEGQEVLIQIAKEPIGKKGARITSHIALPGRFLVFMPTVNHIGVSRKISSDEERMRLKRIVASERENGHGGFIVRTAAANVKEDELRADIRFLKHLWSEIKTRADAGKSPALIYHDLNLVERILRDQVTQDFSQIWVDNEQEYERIVRFASRFQPGLLRRIKLYTKDTPLFEQFGIQEEINKSLKAKVWLKSGGYIVINQTEALVAIDINTGKYVGKTTRLEDTIVKTNVDAIKEIVRQVRLRDLGGIIVIDFIDMDERKNRQKVMQALEEALKADRAPSKVLQFNDFGLVAITRKRVKQSLERTLATPCPYCDATGFVKSVSTVCNEIYTEMRKKAKHLEDKNVMLRVNPEVAKELKSANGKWLQEMEDLVGRPILLKPDASLHQENFDVIG
jgi:Rne/Rng family ribonuclease